MGHTIKEQRELVLRCQHQLLYINELEAKLGKLNAACAKHNKQYDDNAPKDSDCSYPQYLLNDLLEILASS